MEKLISRRDALKNVAMGALGAAFLPVSGCKKNAGEGYTTSDAIKEIKLVLSYGQSNSIGAGGGNAVTTRQMYDSLMFNGGVRPDPANPKLFERFVPLIEANKGFSETPLSGCAETFISNFTADTSAVIQKNTWQFLCAAPGVGGQKIAALSKDASTGYYQRALDYAKYAKANCDKLGKQFEIPIMLWTQGGSDISSKPDTKINYYNRLNKLISDYNVDLISISGQQNSLIWLGNQECKNLLTDQNGVAQAQFDVMVDNPSFTLCNPGYILKYEDDKAHYKPDFDRIQGAYYGLFAAKWLLTSVKPRPLYPIAILVNNMDIVIKYHVPQPPLVFDTSWIEAAPNMGFRVTNASGKELGISSVIISAEDSVTVTVDGNPAGGNILYGRPRDNDFIKRGNYLMLSGRGNLRDSQGANILRYGFAMHNYSLVFNMPL